eukprot:5806257-Prymnesium_polylepis.3
MRALRRFAVYSGGRRTHAGTSICSGCWQRLDALASRVSSSDAAHLLSSSGSSVPRTMEMPTIRKSASEIAKASVGVASKATTRMKPAATTMNESAAAMRTSEAMNDRSDAGLTSPVARPRMMRTDAWFPALPPAPTNIVMK